MEHEKILRINELAKKKKEIGLTDEEAEERKTLHAQYIKEFREQTEATLKRVRVEQDDGSYKPLVKKEKKPIFMQKEIDDRLNKQMKQRCIP